MTNTENLNPVHVLILDEAGSPEILAAYRDQYSAKLHLLDLWLQDQRLADSSLTIEDLLFAVHEDSDDRYEAEFQGCAWVIQAVHVN